MNFKNILKYVRSMKPTVPLTKPTVNLENEHFSIFKKILFASPTLAFWVLMM